MRFRTQLARVLMMLEAAPTFKGPARRRAPEIGWLVAEPAVAGRRPELLGDQGIALVTGVFVEGRLTGERQRAQVLACRRRNVDRREPVGPARSVPFPRRPDRGIATPRDHNAP